MTDEDKQRPRRGPYKDKGEAPKRDRKGEAERREKGESLKPGRKPGSRHGPYEKN